jgi:hypothetical protein
VPHCVRRSRRGSVCCCAGCRSRTGDSSRGFS